MNLLLRTTIAIFACASISAHAGRYPASGTQTFTFNDGTTSLGDASVVNSSFAGTYTKVMANRLLLGNRAWSGNSGVWKLPNLDTGAAVQDFDATFTVGMYKSGPSTSPGKGWALSFGAIPASGYGSGDLGFSMANGIVIGFDPFADTTNDKPSIEVYCNNVSVGNFLATGLAPTPQLINGGTFTLTNPVTGGTTAAIAFNATTSVVQAAMRAVSGWSLVTVSGNPGEWIINKGEAGSYADPVANGAGLTGPGLPAGTGTLAVVNIQNGNATTNENWSINLAAITGGTFTLTNPVTGGTTSAMAYNVPTATLQSTMRLVSGWSGVVVTGSPGAWIVTNGANGSYSDPTGNGASLTGPGLTPGQGGVVITNTQDGTPTQKEVWSIALASQGFQFDSVQRTVNVHWDYNGLDVTYNGQIIFSDLPTPGFNPASGNTFAFTAATSGGAQDTYLDDVVVTTTPAGPANTGLIISEFMAENASVLEDEDMDTPDWIEIYNGSNASVNLGGYQLTNGTTTWTFPSTTLAAYGHLVVYASGKNRATNPALYHTNFTLSKLGGTVSLLTAGNAVVSTYTYPNQTEDISYGLKYQGGAVGFLDTPSPGAATLYNYIVAPNGPAEDVIFSREGGIITGATPVSITAPLAPGSVVRFTTDNTIPSAGSTLYTAPFSPSTTTTYRARVFTPGYLPGPVSSRTFLHIDGSLSNYNGSGQPFKSHLPLIVLDSFGVSVDSVTDSAQPRPHRLTYGVVIDKDVTGFASITSPVVDFQGRGGTHVRGDSSSGFAQKSYAWETWNNYDTDKDVSILGMPADSDWALYGPYTDKTFIRNFIIYSKMRELHGGVDGFGMRVKMVEVIYNQDPGQSVSYNDYRGVYVLMERIKRGKNRIDIAKLSDKVTDPNLITGGYIFRRDRASSDGTTNLPVGMNSHTPGVLNAAQTTYLTNHINAFNNALNGANFADPVLGYAPYIDVDSFIDNWWFVEIAKQIDGYRLSTYFYKDRGTNSKIVAAPIWDYNLSLGNADYLAGDNPVGWYWNQTDTYWWARLRQDPLYERRNWDRYWELRKGIFNTTSILSYIDQLATIPLNGSTTPVTNNMTLAAGQPSTAENAAMRHYRKYQILGAYVWPNGAGYASRIYYNSNGNATTGEIDWMKNWLVQRFAWLDDQNFTGSVIFRPPVFSNAGGNVPSGTQLTITPYTGTPPGGYTYATGTIYYTVDGSDPAAGAVAPTEYTLVSGSGAACKWIIPSAANGGTSLTAAAGANQWASYIDPPNIASWSTGVTGVGYDTGDGNYNSLIGGGSNTVAMQGVTATCYARITFNIPDQATLDNIDILNLGMKYDDGFRAYINGVQVAGRNDSDPSVVNDPANAVGSAVRDEGLAVQFETIDISSTGKPALRVGTNVLAVHCLNAADKTSSDLIMVPKLTYYPPGGAGGSGGIVYTGALTLSQPVTVKARLFSSGTWSPITTAKFVTNAVPASASNIVVSEFLYNPTAATAAEVALGYGDNDFEYIELMNVGPGNVDLTGCNITGGVTFDFDIADPGTLTLAPGQRIVVAANVNGFIARYGASPAIRRIGPFSGSLSNQGESFTVIDINNNPIATVSYLPTAPWPVEASTLGYSLVLNNPASGATYGADKWRIGAQPGGTPGGAAGPGFTGNPNGDTDGDGFSDYLEYALGNSESIPGTGNRPSAAVQTHTVNAVPGNYLTFTYRRNNAADGVNYFVELSTNLTAWDSTPAAVTFVSSVPNGDGTSTVTCRATNPFNAAVPQFMRLRVAP